MLEHMKNLFGEPKKWELQNRQIDLKIKSGYE